MSACFKLAEIAHAHTRFDLLAHTCKSPNKFHPASQVACSQKADRGQHPGCALPDRGDPDAPPLPGGACACQHIVSKSRLLPPRLDGLDLRGAALPSSPIWLPLLRREQFVPRCNRLLAHKRHE